MPVWYLNPYPWLKLNDSENKTVPVRMIFLVFRPKTLSDDDLLTSMNINALRGRTGFEAATTKVIPTVIA